MRLPPAMMSRPKRGFNLIEAAIVLGVVGLIIGGIWVAASAVQESRRQSRFLEQVAQIIPAIRKTFDGVDVNSFINFYDDTGPNYMPKSGWSAILPADMIGPGVWPQGPWDGSQIQVGILDKSIVFHVIGIPRATCVALAPKIYALTKSEVADPPVSPHVTDGDDSDILDTPSEAASGCPDETSIFGIGFAVRR